MNAKDLANYPFKIKNYVCLNFELLTVAKG